MIVLFNLKQEQTDTQQEQGKQKEQEMLEHAAFLADLSEYVQMLHFMAY